MLKYLKKYWLFTMLAPLFMIGEVSMDLIQPELMSHIIDDGVLGINSGGVGNLDIILGTGIRMVLFSSSRWGMRSYVRSVCQPFSTAVWQRCKKRYI